VSLAILGLDPDEVATWFRAETGSDGFDIQTMDAEAAERLAPRLSDAIRRCYVADTVLRDRIAVTGKPVVELVAAKLPDAGSTMAGDFGEILAYTFLAAERRPISTVGPLKWRMKQDRTKPAPHSDVVLFVLPTWPTPSELDAILCAEVKTKATDGASHPIPSAIQGSGKDRTSRLARTLQWLRERALLETLEDVEVSVLDRFAHATDHPPSAKEFVAIAVVSDELLAGELQTVPEDLSPDPRLLVLVVPDLRSQYTQAYDAAKLTEPGL
jgi:uncharacterized protein DUF1837